ncbi:MAG: DUF2254 domain-containing protein [Bradyrhizobium sp.]|nr:DUF2254 domain-containing protein [Bradyrhizobium sp.]
MQLWLIPTFYAVGSVVGGFVVPRLETAFFGYSLNLSTSSAQAYLSSVASGMMALTGIVFSIAFVLVQFNAIVYSPRLVVWFARDRLLFHSLGMFVATFMYSLATLAWIDRTDTPGVPLVSGIVVAGMLIASVLMLSQLVERLNNRQIMRVLHIPGDTGREVIRSTYHAVRWSTSGKRGPDQLRLQSEAALIIRHEGKPRAVTSIDIERVVDYAHDIDGVIVVECAVGDTLIEDSAILRLHGKTGLSEKRLKGCIHLGDQRTFEQDPKFIATAGRHCDQGAVSGDQRPDNGRAGDRPDRGLIATAGQVRSRDLSCVRWARHPAGHLSDADMG